MGTCLLSKSYKLVSETSCECESIIYWFFGSPLTATAHTAQTKVINNNFFIQLPCCMLMFTYANRVIGHVSSTYAAGLSVIINQPLRFLHYISYLFFGWGNWVIVSNKDIEEHNVRQALQLLLCPLSILLAAPHLLLYELYKADDLSISDWVCTS